MIVNNVNNRVSYNGGRGGLNVRPAQSEFNAMREQHVRPLPTQVRIAPRPCRTASSTPLQRRQAAGAGRGASYARRVPSTLRPQW